MINGKKILQHYIENAHKSNECDESTPYLFAIKKIINSFSTVAINILLSEEITLPEGCKNLIDLYLLTSEQQGENAFLNAVNRCVNTGYSLTAHLHNTPRKIIVLNDLGLLTQSYHNTVSVSLLTYFILKDTKKLPCVMRCATKTIAYDILASLQELSVYPQFGFNFLDLLNVLKTNKDNRLRRIYDAYLKDNNPINSIDSLSLAIGTKRKPPNTACEPSLRANKKMRLNASLPANPSEVGVFSNKSIINNVNYNEEDLLNSFDSSFI